MTDTTERPTLLEDDDLMLTTPEAAAFLRVSPKTMERWRWLGLATGPEFHKYGGAVRYRKGALRRWRDARVRTNTGRPEAGGG